MGLNEIQTEKLGALLDGKTEKIKAGNQGSPIDGVLGDDILKSLQSISPSIKSISLNYYNCDGVVVAAIKLNNSVLRYDNGVSTFKTKGFKIATSSGSVSPLHLSDYTWLWKIVNKPISPDYGKVLKEAKLSDGRPARIVVNISGNESYQLDRSEEMDGSDFRNITSKSRYYILVQEELNK